MLNAALKTVPSIVVHRDPEIMGGELVFVGTRVPVTYLFEYLAAGHDIDFFIDAFPTVTHEQAVRVVESAQMWFFAHV